jgi:type III secretion system YscQ/HrcQ family protein
MKADPTEQVPASETNGGDASSISDPFAIDLFAVGRTHTGASKDTPQGEETSGTVAGHAQAGSAFWYKRLPSISRAQARLSIALDQAAPALSPRVIETSARLLARYLYVSVHDVSLSFIESRERESEAGASSIESDGGVWAALAVAPSGAQLAAGLDASFAAALVDRMLGGEGATPETLRALSRMERTVIEFLWLSLLRELNAECGEPFWRLAAINEQPPSWLLPELKRKAATEATGLAAEATDDTDDTAARRVLVMTVRLRAGSLAGLVRFYLSPETLTALDAARNPLFLDARRPQEQLASLTRIAPELSLHPLLGETELTAGDLAQLEPGDVVLVARPWAGWRWGHLTGHLELRVGDGRRPVLGGTIITPFEPDGKAATDMPARQSTANLKLLLESIKGGERATTGERLNMEEDEVKEDASENAIALDDLLLTVQVELAARRLTLSELSRLRVGQLLELGCKATDPVELVADGRRIARGELVEIEGQLGVRLTQLVG